MILIRFITGNENQIEQIAKYLLQNQLVVNLNLKHPIKHLDLVNDEIHYSNKYILVGKTKSLLFNRIEKEIKELIDPNIEIYSLPIVQMDEAQTMELSSKVFKI